MAEEKAGNPLTPEAQVAKEEMQEQLMRRMAAKVVDNAAEEERQRRVKEELSVEEQELRSKAYDKLIVVQEDLVRYVNQMKVSSLYSKISNYNITFITLFGATAGEGSGGV